jgi:hypothetical protein
MVATAGCALMLASLAQAGSPSTVGVVTAVDGNSVQVTAKAGATTSLHLDGRSQFVKWITHQPWQQDNRADRSKLTIGRCVQIDSDDANVARLVRINLDDTGTVWSPCKDIAASLR